MNKLSEGNADALQIAKFFDEAIEKTQKENER